MSVRIIIKDKVIMFFESKMMGHRDPIDHM